MSQSPISKAVFPVAGLDARMLPATRSIPKEMLPVGCRPVVQYLVDEMRAGGLSKFLFVSSKKKGVIEDYFDDDPTLPPPDDQVGGKVQVFYVSQSRQAGNGHAVGLAEGFVGDASFVVGFGDTLIRSQAKSSVVARLIESHMKTNAAATIAAVEVVASDAGRHGIVRPAISASEPEDDFLIDDIVERPAPDEAPANLAVAARYVFSPDIFAALRATPVGKGNELWLADAIRVLIKEGKQVRCVRMRSDERRYDIDTPQAYFQAFADFALDDPDYGEAFRHYLHQRLESE